MENYVITYAKIVINKEDGIVLDGVYFGGETKSYSEAELLAKECVNTVKGGTILPKIMQHNNDLLLIDTLYEATERFEEIVKNMVNSNKMLLRKKRSK